MLCILDCWYYVWYIFVDIVDDESDDEYYSFIFDIVCVLDRDFIEDRDFLGDRSFIFVIGFIFSIDFFFYVDIVECGFEFIKNGFFKF